MIAYLPGWEGAETRINPGTAASSEVINQEHGIIKDVVRKWARGVPWMGRPSGRVASWLKEELENIGSDDKVVFVVFAREGEKRRWRSLVDFVEKIRKRES